MTTWDHSADFVIVGSGGFAGGLQRLFPDHKGGKAAGRSIECTPFDARELGEWCDRIVPGMAEGLGLAVKTNEIRSVSHYNRSPRTFLTAARVATRTAFARLRRQKLLTNGASLIAQILRIALVRRIPVWLGTTVEELLVEGGRVVGVHASKGGKHLAIEARRAVLLCSGGFAHNAETRSIANTMVFGYAAARHAFGPDGAGAT